LDYYRQYADFRADALRVFQWHLSLF
jgi:hypothetical protein